jgi:hypothetical protein
MARLKMEQDPSKSSRSDAPAKEGYEAVESLKVRCLRVCLAYLAHCQRLEGQNGALRGGTRRWSRCIKECLR